MLALLIFQTDRAPSYQTRAYLHMRKRNEYQSKVTTDTGMARSRVPTPLLKQIGARAGNYLTFRLVSNGEVVMRLSPSKPVKTKPKRRSS
jgi:hypothetical protein